MSQSATPTLTFASATPLPLTVDFQGGRLTSDGGWAWVAEADEMLGLSEELVVVGRDRLESDSAHGAVW